MNLAKATPSKLYAPSFIRKEQLKEYDLLFEQVYDQVKDERPCVDFGVAVKERVNMEYKEANIDLGYLNTMYSLEELIETCEETAFSDLGQTEYSMMEEADRRICKADISNFLASLKPREREVIELRFGFSSNTPRSLGEIGITVGVTRERIRQIETNVLNKLNRFIRLNKMFEEVERKDIKVKNNKYMKKVNKTKKYCLICGEEIKAGKLCPKHHRILKLTNRLNDTIEGQRAYLTNNK